MNTTQTFLFGLYSETRNAILDNIAAHYGITREEALAEVIDDEAEHLCDYVTGPMREATHFFMKRKGFA